MQIDSAVQFEALSRLKRLERVQRLRTLAKGRSWLRGRMLYLAAFACGIAWVMVAEGVGEQRVVTWVLFLAVLAVVGVEESLGRRIDAVLELLELEREHATNEATPTVPLQAKAPNP